MPDPVGRADQRVLGRRPGAIRPRRPVRDHVRVAVERREIADRYQGRRTISRIAGERRNGNLIAVVIERASGWRNRRGEDAVHADRVLRGRVDGFERPSPIVAQSEDISVD